MNSDINKLREDYKKVDERLKYLESRMHTIDRALCLKDHINHAEGSDRTATDYDLSQYRPTRRRKFLRIFGTILLIVVSIMVFGYVMDKAWFTSLSRLLPFLIEDLPI